VRNLEVQLCAPDGTRTDGLLAVEGVMIQEEACALYVVQDNRLRKHTETELLQAIEAVMQDASWFSRIIMDKLAQLRHPHSDTVDIDSLTPREHEVLELICNGKTNGEIAGQLELSTNTVRNHVATLYTKIGVNNRSAAVIWGRERGCGLESKG
jgi:DNA-binding NarL/FixJ family response regulator